MPLETGSLTLEQHVTCVMTRSYSPTFKVYTNLKKCHCEMGMCQRQLGVVLLEMKLPGGKTRKCKLVDVLYVPKLSYSLLSVSKTIESGKTTKFNETRCQILGKNDKVIAAATHVGSLYYLNCQVKQQVNAAQCKEVLWHQGYGHLGTESSEASSRQASCLV